MIPTLLMAVGGAFAADHIDAPAASVDVPADISDFFVWHDGSHLTAVLCFAPFGVAGDGAMYDPDVLYGIHIDTNGDNEADHEIWARFGTDSLGNWGVQVEGMPGTGAPVAGPVESVIQAPGGRIYAGLRDDPFFFDFDGLTETLSTATLSFDATDDAFEGTNVTSIVVEMDQGAAANGADNIQMWATTARITTP